MTRWFLQQRIEDTEGYVDDWAAYGDHDHQRVVAVLDGVMVGQATLGVVDGSRVSRQASCLTGKRGGMTRLRSRCPSRCVSWSES
ncbi:MAG TPA: hypothetical protein VFU98_13215 [Microlunatus sp.]|nr:hypothetical protein [Microlunatus sp.]